MVFNATFNDFDIHSSLLLKLMISSLVALADFDYRV
jgi:hypothetical protein